MTTHKRDPGITPLDGVRFVHAETGEALPKSQPEPRRRRAPLAVQPVPPRADIQALHDDLFSGLDPTTLDELAKTYAGIKVRELRAERTALDTELAEVEHLVKQHRSLFPRDLIPTGLIGRFDRARDAIVANERAMAEVRHTLAPGMDEIVVLTPKQRREQAARQAKTAAVLEAARTQGRREYAAASGMIDKLLASPPASPPAAPLVASSSRSSLAAARADANHPDHAMSQRVTFEGRPSMIFTGR